MLDMKSFFVVLQQKLKRFFPFHKIILKLKGRLQDAPTLNIEPPPAPSEGG